MPRVYRPKGLYVPTLTRQLTLSHEWEVSVGHDEYQPPYVVIVRGVYSDSDRSFGMQFVVCRFSMQAVADHVVEVHNAWLKSQTKDESVSLDPYEMMPD